MNHYGAPYMPVLQSPAAWWTPAPTAYAPFTMAYPVHMYLPQAVPWIPVTYAAANLPTAAAAPPATAASVPSNPSFRDNDLYHQLKSTRNFA